MEYIYKIYSTCPFCGAVHYVEAPEAGIKKWRSGELIQNAMPNLSPLARDQLITGMCPDCLKMTVGNY